MKILFVSDNEYLCSSVREIVSQFTDAHSEFAYSYHNTVFLEKYKSKSFFYPIDVKKEQDFIINNFDLVFSIHCKQLFPKKLVQQKRCINVHPGFNPYNRGWFPQVFSIINKLPVGVTIHEMDEMLDHGGIILQEKVPVESFDTSYTVYKKIIKKEIELLGKHMLDIIKGNYVVFYPETDGNLNRKTDFNGLCEINLLKTATYGEVIDFLRAMTFESYKNAYFVAEDGKKIFVNIQLKE